MKRCVDTYAPRDQGTLEAEQKGWDEGWVSLEPE